MNARQIIAAVAAGAVLTTSSSVVAEVTQHDHDNVCFDETVGTVVDGELLCVHGDQPPPPGVDPRRRPSVDELRGRRLGFVHNAEKGRGQQEPTPDLGESEPSQAANELDGTGLIDAAQGYQVKCIGDGVTGPRVQAVYAVATDQLDRRADLVPLIRQYAADIDMRINRSAAAHGEGRRVRYVTQPTADGCRVDVRVAYLSPTGDDSFSNTRSELRAQGMNATDRKYLVWVDAAVGICGLGELYMNDTPTQDNPNNRGPLYARVDAPCFGYAETHELLHTMGAVQASAPHSTNAGHCTQTVDAMCYSDASGVTMTGACPNAPSYWVDCNLDDYFAADPATNSYLANNWNVARSAFLQPDVAPPPPPRVTINAPDTMLTGTTVGVHANITAAPGRSFSVVWSSSRGDCRFGSRAAAETSFYCPATAAGDVRITASVADDLGMAASSTRTIRFTRPESPRRTKLSFRVSSDVVRYGDSITISGMLTDASTGKSVGGMPVSLYSMIKGTTSYRQQASGTTDRTGRVELRLRPTASATMLLASASSSTWRQASSTSRPLKVRYAVEARNPVTAEPGTIVTVRSRIAAPDAGIPIKLRRITRSGAETIATTLVSRDGEARLRLQLRRGTYTLRVVVPGTTKRATGRSREFTLRVG